MKKENNPQSETEKALDAALNAPNVRAHNWSIIQKILKQQGRENLIADSEEKKNEKTTY